MGCVVRAWYQVDRSTRNGELYERRFLLLSDHPLAELPAPKNKAKGEILFYAGIGEHFYDGINLGSLRDRPHESCGPVSVTPPFTPFCTLLIPSRSAGNETSFRWIHRMSYCLLISWASGRNETKVSPDRPAPTTRERPAIRSNMLSSRIEHRCAPIPLSQRKEMTCDVPHPSHKKLARSVGRSSSVGTRGSRQHDNFRNETPEENMSPSQNTRSR